MGNPISIRLADDNQEMVDRFAQMTKRSRSFVINEAVEQYMRDRIQHLEELTDAVADAKSGYGHSSNQIHTWMRSWGSDDEQSSPEPDIIPDH
mgnify:CR=1 FL=1